MLVYDLSQDRLDLLAAGFVAAGLGFTGLQADLGSAEAAADLIARARQVTGRIDILVNLQGVNRRKPIVDVTPEDFDLITSVNLRSVCFLSQVVHPAMQAQGGGKILHFGSVTANMSFDTISVYAATKAAVASLARSQAHEWAADNIQVSAIEPGFVQTEFTRPLWDDDCRAEWFANFIPQGRLGVPQDLVTTALFLAPPPPAISPGRTS